MKKILKLINWCTINTVYIYRIKDYLVDSLYIVQAIYIGLFSTPIQTISEENESVHPLYEQKIHSMKQQIKMLKHYFLIHYRHIAHQDLQVNIMHKDMTPNATIEKEITLIVIVHIMLKMNYLESVQLGQLNSFKTQNSRPQKIV